MLTPVQALFSPSAPLPEEGETPSERAPVDLRTLLPPHEIFDVGPGMSFIRLPGGRPDRLILCQEDDRGIYLGVVSKETGDYLPCTECILERDTTAERIYEAILSLSQLFLSFT